MSMAKRAILEMVIGLAGFGLFWYATNWIAALGLFIALFANNIGHSSRA